MWAQDKENPGFLAAHTKVSFEVHKIRKAVRHKYAGKF
jgi:hypothetical protein